MAGAPAEAPQAESAPLLADQNAEKSAFDHIIPPKPARFDLRLADRGTAVRRRCGNDSEAYQSGREPLCIRQAPATCDASPAGAAATLRCAAEQLSRYRRVHSPGGLVQAVTTGAPIAGPRPPFVHLLADGAAAQTR
jgi:hypothetical protein